MMLGSACTPLPSEVIMSFAGFAAQRGELSFWWVVVAGTVGSMIGSVLSYVVGYYGGRPLLERYGKCIMVTKKEIDMTHSWFDRYGSKTVFITRLLPIVRAFVSLPAGIARMDFSRFFVYSLLGSLPWCIGLAYAGVVLGENWNMLEPYWTYVDILTAMAVVAFILYVLYKMFRNKGHNEQKA
jgi:membrane protein DedA with SNARE-associated domain